MICSGLFSKSREDENLNVLILVWCFFYGVRVNFFYVWFVFGYFIVIFVNEGKGVRKFLSYCVCRCFFFV